jgi:hypothetical protein
LDFYGLLNVRRPLLFVFVPLLCEVVQFGYGVPVFAAEMRRMVLLMLKVTRNVGVFLTVFRGTVLFVCGFALISVLNCVGFLSKIQEKGFLLSDDSHHQGWWLSKVDLVFGASLI